MMKPKKRATFVMYSPASMRPTESSISFLEAIETRLA